ncbi:MAG: phosphoribosylglycinamide formyltransferase [Planctomycetota bacterium]
MKFSDDAPAKLACLISGSGRSLENLAEQVLAQDMPARIVLVISSRPGVRGLEVARDFRFPAQVLSPREFASPQAFGDAVWQEIRKADCDFVCLLGFLSFLPIPKDYEGRVLNIHPSLLPKYGGKGMYGDKVHEAVLAAGDTESGCTVHYATNEYDAGPIILQRKVEVLPDDTPETLAARVFEEEKVAFPEALKLLV